MTRPRPLSSATHGSISGSAYGANRRTARCATRTGRDRPPHPEQRCVSVCSWFASTSTSAGVTITAANAEQHQFDVPPRGQGRSGIGGGLHRPAPRTQNVRRGPCQLTGRQLRPGGGPVGSGLVSMLGGAAALGSAGDAARGRWARVADRVPVGAEPRTDPPGRGRARREHAPAQQRHLGLGPVRPPSVTRMPSSTVLRWPRQVRQRDVGLLHQVLQRQPQHAPRTPWKIATCSCSCPT